MTDKHESSGKQSVPMFEKLAAVAPKEVLQRAYEELLVGMEPVDMRNHEEGQWQRNLPDLIAMVGAALAALQAGWNEEVATRVRNLARDVERKAGIKFGGDGLHVSHVVLACILGKHDENPVAYYLNREAAENDLRIVMLLAQAVACEGVVFEWGRNGEAFGYRRAASGPATPSRVSRN